ncbi:MAG: formate dehydrogenase [Nitrosomonadaceae bacterium]|jgi:hypothetical protein|nr:formate dehydrogenase [Nitrosomonadaceae bacterium]
MKSATRIASICATLVALSTPAWAKLPPPPPPTPEQAAAAAAKAEKDKAAAEKAKADQARYEDKAVTNFQSNMRKAGKPIPKPVAIAAAPTPAAAKPAAAPAKK